MFQTENGNHPKVVGSSGSGYLPYTRIRQEISHLGLSKIGENLKQKTKRKKALLFMIYFTLSIGCALPKLKGEEFGMGVPERALPASGMVTSDTKENETRRKPERGAGRHAIANEKFATNGKHYPLGSLPWFTPSDSTKMYGLNFLSSPVLVSDVTDIGSGPVMWLKADAGVTGTTTVTNWADQTANGNDAAHATAGPELVTDAGNFNPGLRFDAGTGSTGEYLTISGLTLDASVEDLTVFVVFNTADNTLDQHILDQDNSPSTTDVPMEVNTAPGFSRLRSRYGQVTANYVAQNLDNNTNYLAGFTSEQSDDNNTTSNQLLFFNGTRGNTGTPTVESVTGGWILSSDIPNDDLDGVIFEVIVYDEVLSDVDRVKVESYLSLKYGITLSNDNDGDATTGESLTGFVEGDYLDPLGNKIWNYTAAYHNDIAGIGYDESDFSQLKSKSQSSNSIVTIEDTNGGATMGDPARGYLIWGNDATVTTATTSDVPAKIFERMTRVWRTEYASGGLDGVSIEFDLTGLGYDGNTVDDFALIISTSATMASGALTTPTSFASSILTFDNIDFTSGSTSFFTLSLGTIAPGGVGGGLYSWFKADAGVTGTAPVTNWTDQALTGIDAQHATKGPDFVSSIMNFNPALLFDRTVKEELRFEIDLNPSETDLTVFTPFIPTRTPGNSNQSSILAQETGDVGGAGGRPIVQLHLTSGLRNRFENSATIFWDDGYVLDSLQYLSFSSLQTDDNDKVSSLKLYKNGVANGAFTPDVETANGAWKIGNNRNTGMPFSGYIPEIIVYDEVLSDPNRKRVDSYLAIKYGATLDNTGGGTNGDYVDSDGTTYWSATTNAGYHKNVAGIGNDLNSGLTQKQSKSIVNGTIVTIGLDDDVTPDGLETSNANNDGSFSADNSYMAWGSDGASFVAVDGDPATDEIPTGVNSRLNRQWRVQEIGTVGTVTVQFDLSTIPRADNETDIVLVVSDEENFASGTATITIVVQSFVTAADNLANFRVDLPNGAYFTLGSAEFNALPITMLSFAGKAASDHVMLDWSTASEVNNSFFDVERRTVSGTFERIGSVVGAGNSSDIQEYSFQDGSPKSGVNHYRVVDFSESGERGYSEMVMVEFSIPKQEPVPLKLYPNPVSQGSEFVLDLTHVQEEFELQMFDTNGQFILSKTKYNDGQILIPTSGMKPGIYMVKCIESNGKQSYGKIIVTN